ncbi:hypothetical protein DAEQUDRAFT_471473 [Daedalea quercina L-15889]|uniref:Uncharacterized protein n=1 Tax=Daedalea quercina L-15889 TaxID=1314783 RepID=A0A165MYQ4_9APHY|nr:hypothetical protein DAEQUDRAFT_471473 [Daedalea quercina L-15889]
MGKIGIPGMCRSPNVWDTSNSEQSWYRRELKEGCSTWEVYERKFPYAGILPPTRILSGTSLASPLLPLTLHQSHNSAYQEKHSGHASAYRIVILVTLLAFKFQYQSGHQPVHVTVHGLNVPFFETRRMVRRVSARIPCCITVYVFWFGAC